MAEGTAGRGACLFEGQCPGKVLYRVYSAEYAWAPIEAKGYLYIDCLWVSGQFKGHGYSSLLLNACMDDGREKGKKGLVILSSKKKAGFLSDPGYLKYKGFQRVDAADPYFELWCLPFEEGAELPRFGKSVHGHENMPKGFVLYYTNQCPFTGKISPTRCAGSRKADEAGRRNFPQTVSEIFFKTLWMIWKKMFLQERNVGWRVLFLVLTGLRNWKVYSDHVRDGRETYDFG